MPCRGTIIFSRLFHNPRPLIVANPKMLTFSASFTSWPHIVHGRGMRTASERFRSKVGIGEFQGRSSLSFCSKPQWGRRATRSQGLSRISALEFSSKETDSSVSAGAAGRSDGDESFLESFESKCSKLKCDFEAARKGFLNIPEAIRDIPKMDPNGALLPIPDFGGSNCLPFE